MHLLFRPQSLYLLLAIVCAAIMYFLPFATFLDAEGAEAYLLKSNGCWAVNGTSVVDASPMLPLDIVVIVLTLILTVTLFMFKNRKRQGAIARSSYLVSILLIGGAFMAINSFKAYLDTGAQQGVVYEASFYLPFAVIAFTFLAGRSIKKDEELISSLDRLR